MTAEIIFKINVASYVAKMGIKVVTTGSAVKHANDCAMGPCKSQEKNWAASCGMVSSGICLRCPLTESLDTIKCINGEQMPVLDFAHVWDESESVPFVYA